MSKLQLITRADDAGSCRSANEAILEGVESGIIKNVSFMACGPEIEHAVELLGGRDDIAYGFHVCLNAEWEDVKWKPLLPSELLVDENGYFLPFPNDTKEKIGAFNETTLGEIMREVEAQFQKLRDLGLNSSYLDEHMGIGSIGFREQLGSFCQQHELVNHVGFSYLRGMSGSGDLLLGLKVALNAAEAGNYVWVTHPGKEEPDMQNFNLVSKPKGVVSKERDAERRLLTDPRLPDLFKKWNVKAVRYDEI